MKNARKVLVILIVGYVLCLSISSMLRPPTPTPDPGIVKQTSAEQQLIVKVIPRDSESTGEAFRVEKRDVFGVLREIEVKFADGTTGRRYYENDGSIKITRETDKGGVLEAVLRPGRSLTRWVHKDSQGVVKLSVKSVGGKVHLRTYRNAGTIEFEKILTPDSVSVRLYHADGKTLQLSAIVDSTGKRLEVYNADGKLSYSERPIKAEGEGFNYEGELSDSPGRFYLRTSSRDGPYNWETFFTSVSVLAEDGTVKSSEVPESYVSGGDRKYKDPRLQVIVDLKNRAFKMWNRSNIKSLVFKSELEQILKD
ncbi:MAG: hypothetical protein K2W95_32290 [Candidatus Obscuribacterales bacterium]|nr:hypothetical protein [Candidatus Obscuribacterales bacterium]